VGCASLAAGDKVVLKRFLAALKVAQDNARTFCKRLANVTNGFGNVLLCASFRLQKLAVLVDALLNRLLQDIDDFFNDARFLTLDGLLLKKIFWRNDFTPAFELRRLGVETLGFSEGLPTKVLKQKIFRLAQRLLDHDVIRLPLGVESAAGLFEKQAKGVHAVRFFRGDYFSKSPPTKSQKIDSPLHELLLSIGFDDSGARRILSGYPVRLVQEWADITLAAKERGMIRESPPAYMTHYLKEAAAKRTTPPDWWREARKREFLQQQMPLETVQPEDEEAAFNAYLRDEAHVAFERVMQRLFTELRDAGQSDTDARTNAEYTARIHLRRQFREQHPLNDRSRPTRLSDLLSGQ
jgi:hypothetical protein